MFSSMEDIPPARSLTSWIRWKRACRNGPSAAAGACTPQTAEPNLSYAEYDSLEFRVLMFDPSPSLRGDPPQPSKSRWTWGRSLRFANRKDAKRRGTPAEAMLSPLRVFAVNLPSVQRPFPLDMG